MRRSLARSSHYVIGALVAVVMCFENIEPAADHVEKSAVQGPTVHDVDARKKRYTLAKAHADLYSKDSVLPVFTPPLLPPATPATDADDDDDGLSTPEPPASDKHGVLPSLVFNLTLVGLVVYFFFFSHPGTSLLRWLHSKLCFCLPQRKPKPTIDDIDDDEENLIIFSPPCQETVYAAVAPACYYHAPAQPQIYAYPN